MSSIKLKIQILKGIDNPGLPKYYRTDNSAFQKSQLTQLTIKLLSPIGYIKSIEIRTIFCIVLNIRNSIMSKNIKFFK